ncbi:pentapeptide repeat-containing protein, partial [Clostridium perfringens]
MAAKIKMMAPQLPAELNEARWEDVLEDEDRELVNGLLSGDRFEYEVMDRCILAKVRRRGCSFAHTTFDRMDLTDAVLENCDLSNAVLQKGVIHRVHFKDCKLTGIDLSKANLGFVTFENCVM